MYGITLMTVNKKYPLKLALVGRSVFGENVTIIPVRETAKFYFAQIGHSESKFKKLDHIDSSGRVSADECGYKGTSLSRSPKYLYKLDSPVIKNIKVEYGRKNLVRNVSIEVEKLLKNQDDPRIDEIAKILGIDSN